MSEHNKKIVHQTLNEIWNRGNYSVIEERFSSDYIGHSINEIHGTKGSIQLVSAVRSVFPDCHYSAEDQIAEGDRVVHRWTIRGTHLGNLQGIPPTGRQVKMTGISIYRIANDKLIEGWTNADLLDLLRQIGENPMPGQSD